jgi:hypothetical protein
MTSMRWVTPLCTVESVTWVQKRVLAGAARGRAWGVLVPGACPWVVVVARARNKRSPKKIPTYQGRRPLSYSTMRIEY